MSVRPDILRDRRIEKAAGMLDGISDSVRMSLGAEPSLSRYMLRNQRKYMKRIDDLLYQAEFYAAKAAGEEVPAE